MNIKQIGIVTPAVKMPNGLYQEMNQPYPLLCFDSIMTQLCCPHPIFRSSLGFSYEPHPSGQG